MSHMNLIGIEQVDEDVDSMQLSPGRKKMLETFEKEREEEHYQKWEKENIDQKSKLKLKTKTNSRISTLDGELVEKIEIAPEHMNIRNQIEEEWNKIKFYESFIIEILFEHGLVERLIDSFPQMLENAYQKHCQIKQLKKQKQQKQTCQKQDGALIGDFMNNSGERIGTIKKQSSQISQNSSQKKKIMGSSFGSNQMNEFPPTSRVQLSQSAQFLTQHNKFKKYCFNKYKVENIDVYFSKNCKFFTYKVEGKDNQLVQSMSDLVEVILGKVTKNFKRYLKKGEEPQDNVSFSLVFIKRTYDLEAQSSLIRTKFINGLNDLMQSSDFKK